MYLDVVSLADKYTDFFLTLSNSSGKFCETQNSFQEESNLRMVDHKVKLTQRNKCGIA